MLEASNVVDAAQTSRSSGFRIRTNREHPSESFKEFDFDFDDRRDRTSSSTFVAVNKSQVIAARRNRKEKKLKKEEKNRKTMRLLIDQLNCEN